MKKVINSALSRRNFLRLTSMAAVSGLAPTVLCAEQPEAGESAELSRPSYGTSCMRMTGRPD